ncbi:MAG: GNAT family N-acetyltransferase [Ardenticatenaceae bacterium]
MTETTNDEFVIRHYQEGEEHKRAALVNACRTTDWDDFVTVDMIHNEWHDSRLNLDRDTWVAVNKDGDYISVAEVWFDDPDNDEAVITRHVGFDMHPDYREKHSDLTDELLKRALKHARSRPFARSDKGYVLRAWAPAKDAWKHDVALKHGFKHAHVGYTMIKDDLQDLPPISSVEGIRIEGWSPERDLDFWLALNEGFSTEMTFKALSWGEWLRLYHQDKMDQNLWCLAIDEHTDEVVGLAISEIDHKANVETGRKDGWAVDLAVIKEWRGRGIGRTLLLTAMQKLRQAGMNAVKMGLDSYDPVNGTRLYRSLGFKVMYGSHTYLKTLKPY